MNAAIELVKKSNFEMKHTAASFAIIKANFDLHRHDHIDSLIPFIATVFVKHNYSQFSLEILRRDLCEEFGLDIPVSPLRTVMSRAVKRKIARMELGNYHSNRHAAEKLSISVEQTDQYRRQEKLIQEITSYCRQHDSSFSEVDAEESLLQFIKRNYLDLLLSKRGNFVIPENHKGRNNIQLIASFIKDAHKSHPENFEYICDMALGSLLAGSILFEGNDAFATNPKAYTIFLDSPIILGLLGLRGDEIESEYLDMVNIFNQSGSEIRIFAHNIGEVNQIIYDASEWIESPNYDPRKANNVTKLLKERGWRKTNVILLQETWLKKIVALGIKPTEDIDPNQHKFYQIDEDSLYDKIVENYRQTDPRFCEGARKNSILTDIKSVNQIRKHRKNDHPGTFKQARFFFVTNNSGLVTAVTAYEKEVYGSRVVQSCVTDVLMSTVVWLSQRQIPPKKGFEERRLIAACSAVMRPSKEFLDRFFAEVDSVFSQNAISTEEYYILRTNGVVTNILEDQFFGDPELITSRTPQEVLQKIFEEKDKQHHDAMKVLQVQSEQRIQQVEHRAQSEVEEQRNLATNQANKIVEEELKKQKRRDRCANLSLIISNILFWTLLVIVGVASALSIFANFGDTSVPVIGSLILLIFLSALGIIFGFNLMDFKGRIARGLEKFLLIFSERLIKRRLSIAIFGVIRSFHLKRWKEIMKKKRTLTQIKNIILEFHKSGLTQAEFCREHSLSISTFHNWLRKNRDIVASKPLPNFSFVEVMEETSLPQPPARTLRISTSYGLLLEIPL